MKKLKNKDLRQIMILLSALDSVETRAEETAEFVVSSESEDRHGTIVKQEGLDWKFWKRNPVILADHFYLTDYIVGKGTKVYQKESKTYVQIEWAPTERGEKLRKLYEAGFPLMASIGFIPKEFDEKDDRIITKAEVLEVSITPVGSNRDAVKAGFDEGFVRSCVELGILRNVDEPETPDEEPEVPAEEEQQEQQEQEERTVESRLDILERKIDELASDIKRIQKSYLDDEEEPADDLAEVVKMFQSSVKVQSKALQNLKQIRNASRTKSES